MNPFKDWTVEQQCFDKIARKANDEPTASTDPAACQWCALGRMFHSLATPFEVESFDSFLLERHSSRMVALNDIHQWTPAQFAAAWDEFEAERTQ